MSRRPCFDQGTWSGCCTWQFSSHWSIVNPRFLWFDYSYRGNSNYCRLSIFGYAHSKTSFFKKLLYQELLSFMNWFNIQSVFVRKSFTTIITIEWLFSFLNWFSMLIQWVFLRKSFTTIITFDWLHFFNIKMQF